MKQIALVSYAGCPDLTDDDRLLLPALRHLGVEATCAVWDASVDWSQFDQVVLRSCWDYHLRSNEFLDWVGRIEQSFVPLQNFPTLIHWNVDKRYLRQLEAAGASIPPTVWIEDREEVNVQEILRLWTYAKGLDLVDWGKMRYNLLNGAGGHWFPGRSAAEFDQSAILKTLGAHPKADRIPAILREAHELLVDAPKQRLSKGG